MIAYPSNSQENDFLKAWIAERIPDYHPGTDAICLAVIRDKKIAAVAAFNNWRRTDIEISFAADTPRWASKQAVRNLLSYPFYQLKVQRVSALAKKTNKRVRRLLEGLGFVQEGKLRHAGPNLESLFIYGITRQDYLAKYEQQKEATGTSAGA